MKIGTLWRDAWFCGYHILNYTETRLIQSSGGLNFVASEYRLKLCEMLLKHSEDLRYICISCSRQVKVKLCNALHMHEFCNKDASFRK